MYVIYGTVRHKQSGVENNFVEQRNGLVHAIRYARRPFDDDSRWQKIGNWSVRRHDNAIPSYIHKFAEGE